VANLRLFYRPGFECRAGLLSETLSLPSQPFPDESACEGLALVLDGQGLALQQLGSGAPGPVRCDFAAGAARHRRLYGGGRGQAIAKAVGLARKGFRPRILDLTAGLGRDGFVLASLGAIVTLVEKHPVVHALLSDGLQRAMDWAREENDAALLETLSRMTVRSGDGLSYLEALPDEQVPDVIYLDPMFPPREKSGKVKKEMQLFHELVGQASDEDGQLLMASLDRARYRVVVKRPSHAPFLADREPAHSLKGKSTRFDIYPLKKLP